MRRREVPVRAAVIGTRHPHIREFVDAATGTDGWRLGGIAEEEGRLLGAVAPGYAGPVYSDYRELLDRESPDLVGVATTNARKAEVIADCLARGIHVIADKPLVTDIEGLARVRGALRLGRARLSLLLTLRFHPAYRALHELVTRGALGEVVHATALGPHRLRPSGREPWMLDDASSGGVLVDLGVHYFDLLRWLTGDEARGVAAAQGTKRFPELPNLVDHGHALVEFRAGAVGHVTVDWLTPEASPVHGDDRLFVTGTRGYAALSAAGPPVLTLVTDDGPPQDVPLPAQGVTCSEDFLQAVRDGSGGALREEDVLRSTALSLWARDLARGVVRDQRAYTSWFHE
jgi:predicted dehydrogenase